MGLLRKSYYKCTNVLSNIVDVRSQLTIFYDNIL